MSVNIDRNVLCKYRLDKSKNCLYEAKENFKSNLYSSANNRAYYSIFNSIRALQALQGKSYKRHKDVLGNFNKDFIRTKIFPSNLAKKVVQASEVRNLSDYDDFYIISKKDTEKQIVTAEDVYNLLSVYCNDVMSGAKKLPEVDS